MKFPGSHKIVGTVYSDDTCRKAEELEKEELEKE